MPEPTESLQRRWDGRFFDLPVEAASKAPVDPVLEERLTSPWLEKQAEQRRFAAMSIGSGSAVLGIGGIFLASSFAVKSEADASPLRWTGLIGGGLGLVLLGAGLFSYFALPDPPPYVAP